MYVACYTVYCLHTHTQTNKQTFTCRNRGLQRRCSRLNQVWNRRGRCPWFEGVTSRANASDGIMVSSRIRENAPIRWNAEARVVFPVLRQGVSVAKLSRGVGACVLRHACQLVQVKLLSVCRVSHFPTKWQWLMHIVVPIILEHHFAWIRGARSEHHSSDACNRHESSTDP